ncbi:MAG: hypothetical protein NTU43_01675 [Bacteroidetes bacterium]|nr:hypothetical protein [Bacteroidota bacterium]
MEANDNNFKNHFTNKFLEFQLNGLEAYAAYLNQQMILSKDKPNWAAYKSYIEKEIVRNNKKIESVKAKFKA